MVDVMFELAQIWPLILIFGLSYYIGYKTGYYTGKTEGIKWYRDLIGR